MIFQNSIIRNGKWITRLFFASIFLILFKTFQDYGVTWDEEHHQLYGKLIVDWYQSFFTNKEATRHIFLIFYGGFFDTLVQLATNISPLGVYETRHFLGAMFSLWTIFVSFKIAEHIQGTLAGLFAALFLTLHPVFYGHMFNNPVDIPFAAVFISTVYCIIKTYDQLPKLSFKNLLLLGIALGLTLAVRISAIFVILPSILVCWLTWLYSHRRNSQNLQKNLTHFLRNLFWILIVAWPVMLIWWPWAQLNPIVNPIQAALKSIRWDLNPPEMSVLFEGSYFKFAQTPRHYLPKSILLSLPEYFFIVLPLGIVLACYYFFKNQKFTANTIKICWLSFLSLFPILAAVILNTPQFDGFRHFLFVLPLFAILGALSLASFLEHNISYWPKLLISAGIILSIGMTALEMRYLHPYQSVYFNQLFAGGLGKAAGQYETDYWGNSYREGTLWMMKNYHPALDRKIRVLNVSRANLSSYYLDQIPDLGSRFEMVSTDPDIFLATTRWGDHKLINGKVLYTVERHGVPLMYVIEA